jgi:hypothetical protein
MRQRSIGDLMRYAALNRGADEFTLDDQVRPARELPVASTQSRYSDDQLYALALYTYSLKPTDKNNMVLPVAGFNGDRETTMS